MKKNKMMRIASILAVAVLLSTCVIGGTFAKYSTEATTSDSARVAKWDIEVEDAKIAVTGDQPTVTFDLFNYTDANVDTNGANDDAKVIAPGTTGSFTLTIENLSEVNAEYTIALAETNANNIPLQYSLDNSTWKDSIAELTMTGLTEQAIAMNATKEHTVYWRWVFDAAETDGAHAGQTNANDTILGIGGTAAVTITANILVEQVD